MLPFDVTMPATVPQGSEIPEGLMNNSVYYTNRKLLIMDRSGAEFSEVKELELRFLTK